jgi:hypothetical protein
MDELTEKTVDLTYRKTFARTLLSNNQLGDAIHAYATIVKDFPEDIESLLVLGDLYLAGEDSMAALYFYQKAKLLQPENQEISTRIELAESEKNSPATSKNLMPLGEERLSHLQTRLVGKSKGVQEKEIEKASRLLEEIIHSSHPADLVATHLDQIDSLLPALLEMNIRQAKADRRTDLVEGLETIQENMLPENGAFSTSSTSDGNLTSSSRSSFDLSQIQHVTFLVPDRTRVPYRVSYILDCLTALNLEVSLIDSIEEARSFNSQLLITSNPHMNPWLLEYMAECTAARIPVILDLDADYEQLPMNHPEYLKKGLGLPVNARAYTAAMMLSNIITTPSGRFAEQLSRTGYHSAYVPDGWSRSNPLWEKKQAHHNTINIGWIGGSGLIDDLLEIRRILIRVVREFPRTQLVISEDQKAFQLFENLPQNRKLFLPEVSPEDYPFLLGQFDILVYPLRNIPFNFTQTDTILMQAGIKHIPWVSSRLPMALAWDAGGLIAATTDEWHTNLRQLVMDENVREHLGNGGYNLAKSREVDLMKASWAEIIASIISEPMSRGFNKMQVSRSEEDLI